VRALSTIAGVLLTLAAATTEAATYYVDQTAGSDSNSGTSAGSPWKNSPGMAAYAGSGTLRPGDTVYFDSADTWLLTGGQGLWVVGGVTYLGDSWGTGVRATLRANANLDAGVVRFRDNATFPTIVKGFDVDANHTVSTGVDFGHRFPALLTGAVKRVENLIVRNVWSQSSLDQYKYGIIISNFGGSSGNVSNVEILSCVVHDISRTGIALYPGDDNANNKISNITVRGNETYNTGQDSGTTGPGIMTKGTVQNATIEYNSIHDAGIAGFYVNTNEGSHYGFGPTNIHFRYNIVRTENVYGGIRIADAFGSGDPKDVKIYGNIIYSTTGKAGFLIDTDFDNTNSILVYNNTFYNAPVTINNSTATFSTFEFKNNIVYRPSGTAITGASHFTASSNNLTTNPSFKNASSLPTGFVGTFGVNLAPSTDGLSLLTGSPAIDAGVSLGSAYGGSINSVPRPPGSGWDIGAYEGGGAPAAPTNLRISTS